MGNSFPWCAVCQGPVKRVSRIRDDLANCTRFIAFCHGDREETAIPDDMIEDSQNGRLHAGIAFADKGDATRQITDMAQ